MCMFVCGHLCVCACMRACVCVCVYDQCHSERRSIISCKSDILDKTFNRLLLK